MSKFSQTRRLGTDVLRLVLFPLYSFKYSRGSVISTGSLVNITSVMKYLEMNTLANGAQKSSSPLSAVSHAPITPSECFPSISVHCIAISSLPSDSTTRTLRPNCCACSYNPLPAMIISSLSKY